MQDTESGNADDGCTITPAVFPTRVGVNREGPV